MILFSEKKIVSHSNISRSSCHDTVHMSAYSSKIMWQHCKKL